MKKILTLVISFLLIIQTASLQPVFALGSSDAAEKLEILDVLGIISKDSEGEYVTREEFFGGILHMFYEADEIYSTVEQSAGLGLVDTVKEEEFGGSMYITYNDAVAAVVTALGYEKSAMLQGDYPTAYASVASSLGLLAGVDEERTLSLSRSSVINLFYNMLDVEPYSVSVEADGAVYEIAKNETVLSMKRNIYEISGIVTANEDTSLISPEGNNTAQITIDGENYYIGNTDAGKYLGMHIEGYVKTEDKNEDGTVIFLRAKKSKTSEIEIVADDILSVSDTCDEIVYCEDGSTRDKKVKISDTVRVIYNGKFYDGYTWKDFMPEMGSIRLIDNDNDEVYDCVFITSYETVIVDYTVPHNYEIYGKYSYDNALNYIKFDEDNTDIRYYLDGEEVSIESIGKDDILTIKRSISDGEPLVDVYISRNFVIGSAYALDTEENVITINAEEYPVAKVFYHETEKSGAVSLSESYCFYMDFFGNLVYAKRSASTDLCVFYKIYEDEQADMDYKIVYMNDNSEWNTAPLAKRVRFNGTSVDASVVYNEIMLYEPQVMLIKCNSSGEIKTLTTAEIGKKGEKLLAKTVEQRMRYRSTPKSFDCNIYPETDTKVFVLPEIKENKEDYYVTSISYFMGNKYYTISAYDMDEFNFSSVMSVVANDEVKTSGVGMNLFVVTKINQRLNEYDEPVSVISGCMGKYLNVEFEVKDDSVINGIKEGSIIRIHTDKDNKIDYCTTSIYTSFTDIYSTNLTFEARVVASDYAGGKLKLEKDGNEMYLRHNNSAAFLIYNTKENTCKTGTPKDLIPGDNIIIRTDYALPQEIIVIRNN